MAKKTENKIVMNKDQETTPEIICKDVIDTINPVIELFTNENALLAFGSVLYGIAIEMGGTETLPDTPKGLIDEDSLVDFAQFVGNTISGLKLLKAIIKKEVRIHYINREFKFSKREVENDNKQYFK